MNINAEAEALLKHYEQGPNGGPALVAYRCTAGVLTIGWGHTGPDVYEGQVISRKKAEDLFREDVSRFERLVEDECLVRPTENQFSAMVCLAFNIGPGWSGKKPKGAKEGFRQSSVLRFHNAGNPAKAAESFMLWNKATDANGQLRELRGLTARRAAEMTLYLKQTEDEAAVDPPRTRAADVEPTPIGDDGSNTLTKIAATAATVAGISTAGGQVVSQVEPVWSGLIKAAGPMAPHVIMGFFGLIAVVAVCITVWFVAKRRRG